MLPDETVIDGEVVALDEQGKPNFNLLQNYRSAESHIMLYAFDVLVRKWRESDAAGTLETTRNPRVDSHATRSRRHLAGISPDRDRDARLREESWLGRDHREAFRQHL